MITTTILKFSKIYIICPKMHLYNLAKEIKYKTGAMHLYNLAKEIKYKTSARIEPATHRFLAYPSTN